jgi:hypothetical protein
VGDDDGPAATTSLDPPTTIADTAAAVDGEAPVPTPDQIAGVDVTILATRSQILRERGRWARLTRQLERLNAAIKTLQGVQGALRTAARGDGGNDDGNIRGVGAARRRRWDGKSEGIGEVRHGRTRGTRGVEFPGSGGGTDPR